MELRYDVNPAKFFRKQRIFGFGRYLTAKHFSKIQPVCTPLDPILCVPTCDMKFTGIGSSRPRHCPQAHVKHLAKIALLLKTTVIEAKDANTGWSLRGDTHQILTDAKEQQLFQSSVVPLGSVERRIYRMFKGSQPDFKVLVWDAKGSNVLSMICNGSNFDTVSEVDEMEVFLAKCKLSIGKVVKLPTVFLKEYAVFDEKGEKVYHIYVYSSVLEKSCVLSTYKIFHLQLKQYVGTVHCSRRTWAPMIPKCCLSHGPFTLTFEQMLPLTHKALLLGAAFFVAERSSKCIEKCLLSILL